MAGPETELVVSAFEKFNEASASLEAAYQRLARQFRALSQELSETNERLRRTVVEKERMGNHLRSVLESLSCGVLVSDCDGRITHSNGAVSSLLFAESAPETSLLSIPELSTARPELAAPLDDDGPTELELELSPSPDRVRTLHVERRALLDSAEGGAVFVIRDLTELRELERQAHHMERLAAMGEMALQLAHEIRNPLGGIRLHASLLAQEEGLTDEARSWVDQLEVGVHTLNCVVSNMLSFGRPQQPALAPTDVKALVEEVEGFLRPLTRERHVEVEIDAHDEPYAQTDRDQLRQVLLNLWLNALNAMPSGGRLRISLRRSGEELELSFSDSGPGLLPETRERIFDPYFTTDRSGTGLGLAVSSQIIESHGGRIRVEDAPGTGATFRITLSPAMEETCNVTSW